MIGPIASFVGFVLFLLPGYVLVTRIEGSLPFKQPTQVNLMLKYAFTTLLLYAFLSIVVAICLLFKYGTSPDTQVELFAYLQTFPRTHPLSFVAGNSALVLVLSTIFYFAGPCIGNILLYKIDFPRTLASFPPLFYAVEEEKAIRKGTTLPETGDPIWARVVLRNGDVISGQLAGIPSDFEVLSCPSKDIYMKYAICIPDDSTRKPNEIRSLVVNTDEIVYLEIA